MRATEFELDEAALGPAELIKSNSRLQAFITKYEKGQPFVSRGGDWDKPDLYLEVEPEKLELLKNGEYPRNFLGKDGKVVAWSHIEKTAEFGGKKAGFSTRDEDAALSALNNMFAEMKGDAPEMTINIGGSRVAVSHFESTPGTPKSDFHAVDKDGKAVAWISHKKGSTGKDFQQWGGMSDREFASVYNKHPQVQKEIHKLIADVKQFNLDNNGTEAMARGITLGRKITNGILRGIAVYGIDFGGARGPQNVDLVLQGDPMFDGTTLVGTGSEHTNGERVEDEFEPVFMIMYRSDRSNFGIPNARFMIYPAGGRKVHQWI